MAAEAERLAAARDVKRLRGDLEFVEANAQQFQTLQARGWGRPAGRLHAARLIEMLARQSGLSSLQFNIEPERKLELLNDGLADLDLRVSTIRLNIQSLVELDVLELSSRGFA